jgi:diguanylate cyclase (GGDEF)-like protein/PAS domain S-box-containing protein
MTYSVSNRHKDPAATLQETNITLLKRNLELKLVRQVAQTINSTLHLDEILELTVRQINQAFGYSMVSIYLRYGNLIVPKTQVGLDHKLRPLNIHEGITGRVIRSGQAVHIRDVRLDPDYIPVEAATRQLMAIPFKSKEGSTLGALVIGTTDKFIFGEEEFVLLQLLVNQINIAIENAHLFTKLEQNEQKYRNVVNRVRDIIFQTDKRGAWTFLNPAWQQIFGYSVEQTLGSRFLEYVYPDDRQSLRELWQTVINGRSQYSCQKFRGLTANSEIRWLEICFQPVLDGKTISGTLGTIHDITEQEQTVFLEKASNEILERIALSQPLSDVLVQITRLLEAFHYQRLFTLLLLNEDTIPGLHDFDLASLRTATNAVILTSSQTLLSYDPQLLAVAADYERLAAQSGFQFRWSMPVLSKQGEVLGIFLIFYRSPGNFAALDFMVIERVVHLTAIALEQHRLSAQLLYQAHHDYLTGLPNRLQFQESLAQLLQNAAQVAVIFLDLDRFKQINDTLGHSSGDLLLRLLAERLKTCLPPGDLLARLGGDEFVFALSHFQNPSEIRHFTERILQALKPPFLLNEREFYVTGSLGISLFPADGDSVEDLLANADNAMYEVKKQGRNNYRFFASEMGQGVKHLLELENQLYKALERGEFEAFYQPQVRLSDQKITGAEVLLRWRHPEFGLIPPGAFIGLTEETGLIVPIGEWLLRSACQQLRLWQFHLSLNDFKIAVNVSASQFERDDFVPTVLQILAETDLAPACLELEVTESMLMRDLPPNGSETGSSQASGN